MSETTKALFSAIAHLSDVRETLHRLCASPPQVLLFDGGTEAERRDMARYWAACTLCPSASEHGPCLACQTCQRIAEDNSFDVMAYDGYVAQKDDESSPGFFRAFTAENARNIKARLLDSPKGRYRLVIFTGISASRPEAPNALLKLLEEPSKTALFVLLTPAREQILPTLVSRSLCLTLPWPDPFRPEAAEVEALLDAFAAFFSDKGAFLSTITAKSFLTQSLAQGFVNACEKAIIRVLAGKPRSAVDRVLAALTPHSLRTLMVWLTEANAMLASAHSPVTPSRVLEAFAMNLYGLVKRDAS